MTSRFKLSVAALALLAGTSSAMAADLGYEGSAKDGPSEAPSYRNWTGLWVAALGGYQFSNSELNYDEKKFESGSSGPIDESGSLTVDGLGAEGLFGEIQLGLDKQIGQRIVVGVFGGLNLSQGEFEISASSFDSDAVVKDKNASILSLEQEWGGVAGARLGYLTTPNTMFYVAGGWAFGEIGKFKSDFANGGKGGDVFKDQETDLNGWFGEVGMESRLTEINENLYFTLAGRYTDYSAITLEEGTTGQYQDSLEVDHDTLAAMAGLKLKLGGSRIGLGD